MLKLDGGNVYVLKNYTWMNVNQLGNSQLSIDFNAMVVSRSKLSRLCVGIPVPSCVLPCS